MKKQTAGRNALGEFAPKFAELNDDVLFGEVWSREDKLSARDRSLVTVAALIGSGILDSSLEYHIMHAKENGITAEEMAEAITHIAFYAGWPKAWAAFNYAKKIYFDFRDDWNEIITRGMQKDFSWKSSALQNEGMNDWNLRGMKD